MKLELTDNISSYGLGKKVPKMEPSNLGHYVEQDSNVSSDFEHNEVYRTEVRIGVQTHIDPRMEGKLRHKVYRDTKGMLLRHIYLPVYNELREVLDDLYISGFYKGNPAYDRVVKMLETFEEAFNGD